MTNDYMQHMLKFAFYQTRHRARELLLITMLLALPKDLSVGKSWDLQYNRECHMALALAQ
jgi:hypothetical protein